jgi:hypothetical protein
MNTHVSSVNVREGATGCKPANSIQMYTGNHTDVRYFWNTFWIILGRTLHPLDSCVNSTRRTPIVPNVCYFSDELVAPSTLLPL